TGAKPRLVLRGNLDTGTADDTVTENEILGLPEAPPKPEPETASKGADDATFSNVPATGESDKGRPVEIIRAGQSSTIYYPQEATKEEGTGAATPTARDKTKRPGNSEPRTASGKSPESSAPRKDAGSVSSQGE